MLGHVSLPTVLGDLLPKGWQRACYTRNCFLGLGCIMYIKTVEPHDAQQHSLVSFVMTADDNNPARMKGMLRTDSFQKDRAAYA